MNAWDISTLDNCMAQLGEHKCLFQLHWPGSLHVGHKTGLDAKSRKRCSPNFVQPSTLPPFLVVHLFDRPEAIKKDRGDIWRYFFIAAPARINGTSKIKLLNAYVSERERELMTKIEVLMAKLGEHHFLLRVPLIQPYSLHANSQASTVETGSDYHPTESESYNL